MPGYRVGASLLAILAASPLTALAQVAQPSTVDPLVVTASRSGDATPIDLIGASVSVIDDAALQQRQTIVVSDVLRDVPGVAVSRTGAVGGFTEVRIRGAEGNHTLVMIDGIKASDPFFDEYDFGTLIADQAARISIEKRKGNREVTLITGLEHPANDLPKLCTDLKSLLGTGGSVQARTIEIQGDHAAAVETFLRDRGIRVRG